MKKIVLPLCLFIAGLAVANVFFGVDIKELADGFFDFLADLFGRPG